MIERNIYFIKKDGITELGPDQITIDEVGGKAVGLCYIPVAWSVPFFVISKELLNDYSSNSDQQAIAPYVDNIKKVLEFLNIPEGLYYNYHDTILVDLGSSNIDFIKKSDVNVTIKNKYKDTFIYPDADGTWVAKEIAPPYQKQGGNTQWKKTKSKTYTAGKNIT